MKRTIKFLDLDRNKVVCDCEITTRNGYPEFTMCGEFNNSAGQCFDRVKPVTGEHKQLIDLWNEYHLKDISKIKDFEDNVNELLDKIEEYEEEQQETEVTEENLNLFQDFNRPELCLAIALMLDLCINEINDIEEHDDNSFTVQGVSYLAGTDEEMNEEAGKYIKDSVWAFNTSFIAHYLNDELYDHAETILQPLQEKCESGNDAILALITDIDEFIEDAISADGRGHFLNHWDGGEDEICLNNEYYYMYRI